MFVQYHIFCVLYVSVYYLFEKTILMFEKQASFGQT